jgi:hypothetical protein
VATGAELVLLKEHARKFAKAARDLLNKTVCNGAVVDSVVSWDPDLRQDVVIVGTKLDGLVASPVPLCIDRKKPTCWLEAQFRCDLDDRRRFLMVLSSYFGIYAPDGKTQLCHYDYERTKEGYPAAHLQIEGNCTALGTLPGRRKAAELGKLHFPVGGRRYRPTLEDMVEFVISEGFATGRPGYQRRIDKQRADFHEVQLRAAIRRLPEVAIEVLRDEKKII